MIIPENTQMMLFRYSNYGKFSFIDEHLKVLETADFVWVLKIGRRTSIEKIEAVRNAGGFLILKAPIREGGQYYICHFLEIIEDVCCDETHMPNYYKEIMGDVEFYDRTFQFFKVVWIKPLSDEQKDSLVLQMNEKKVVETVKETRTAVMFIKNTQPFTIPGRK